MKDDRTEEEIYAAWVDAVNKCHAKGWEHVAGWLFTSPKGFIEDLSAMDLDKLDEIEAKR